jgi:hypothetical protein
MGWAGLAVLLSVGCSFRDYGEFQAELDAEPGDPNTSGEPTSGIDPAEGTDGTGGEDGTDTDGGTTSPITKTASVTFGPYDFDSASDRGGFEVAGLNGSALPSLTWVAEGEGSPAGAIQITGSGTFHKNVSSADLSEVEIHARVKSTDGASVFVFAQTGTTLAWADSGVVPLAAGAAWQTIVFRPQSPSYSAPDFSTKAARRIGLKLESSTSVLLDSIWMQPAPMSFGTAESLKGWRTAGVTAEWRSDLEGSPDAGAVALNGTGQYLYNFTTAVDVAKLRLLARLKTSSSGKAWLFAKDEKNRWIDGGEVVLSAEWQSASFTLANPLYSSDPDAYDYARVTTIGVKIEGAVELDDLGWARAE